MEADELCGCVEYEEVGIRYKVLSIRFKVLLAISVQYLFYMYAILFRPVTYFLFTMQPYLLTLIDSGKRYVSNSLFHLFSLIK